MRPQGRNSTLSKRIHILVPSYNRENDLLTLVDSLIRQTYENWRLTVIDNCSDVDVAKFFQDMKVVDCRIEVSRYDKTVPIIENWNRCFNHITEGDSIIKFLWSDDYLEEKYLYEIVKKFEAGFQVVGSDIRYVSEKKDDMGLRKYTNTAPMIFNVIYRNLLGCPSSLAFDRRSLGGIKFDVNNRYCADLKFAISVIKSAGKSSHAHISDDLVNVKIQSGTETDQFKFGSQMFQDKSELAKWYLKEYRQILAYPAFVIFKNISNFLGRGKK